MIVRETRYGPASDTAESELWHAECDRCGITLDGIDIAVPGAAFPRVFVRDGAMFRGWTWDGLFLLCAACSDRGEAA